MTERNTVLRSLHDVGLAAWCGGSLMGAVGLNGAATQEGGTAVETARIAGAGWDRWTPVSAAAIAAHLVGGTGLLEANRARVGHQKGVAASTVTKAALTGAALLASGYARVLGKKIELAHSTDPDDKEKAARHPIDLEKSARQLEYVQWSVPVLTAAVVVLTSLHGEQQRPSQQGWGIVQRSLKR